MIIYTINELAVLLEKALRQYQNVLITTHKNPDGDGLATCLAVKKLLQHNFECKVDILLEKEAPESLFFLGADQETLYGDYQQPVDLLLVLDCHEISRTKIDPILFEKAKQVIFIDHHEAETDKFVHHYWYYIDTQEVSTGTLVHPLCFPFIRKMSPVCKKFYADCIYTTILNDTDNFLNSNVNADTYRICADLMEIGLKPNKVINDFMLSKPFNYFRFVGRIMDNMTTAFDGKLVVLYSDRSMLRELGLNTDATSKLMRWTKGIQGCKVQAYIQEDGDRYFRLSFRSGSVDVAKIAQKFNGGGHKKAAGCEFHGTLEECKNAILEVFEKELT